MKNKLHRGFTLIELLIAMTIFAIITTLTSASLKSIIGEYSHINKSQKQLLATQRVLLKITQDLTQITKFSTKNSFGDKKSVFEISEDKTKIEFISSNWHNYTNQTRSNLIFVTYQLISDKLVRSSSKHIIDIDKDKLSNSVWLSGVESLEITLESKNGQKTKNIKDAIAINFELEIARTGKILHKVLLPNF